MRTMIKKMRDIKIIDDQVIREIIVKTGENQSISDLSGSEKAKLVLSIDLKPVWQGENWFHLADNQENHS